MNKYFDKNVYLRTMSYLSYGTIAILAIGMFTMFVTQNFVGDDMIRFFVSTDVYNPVDSALNLVMTIGASLLSTVGMAFVWTKRGTDYMYSMPVTKGKLYVSKLLGIITLQFSILVFITLLGIVFTLKYIGTVVFIGDMLMSLVSAMIGSLVIIGAVFLTIGITGKILSSTIFSFGIVAMPALMSVVRVFDIRGISVSSIQSYNVIKPGLYVITNSFISFSNLFERASYIPGIIFSLVLAIGYIVAGYFLFKKRSGELTGTHTKNKAIHFVTMGTIPFFLLYGIFYMVFYERVPIFEIGHENSLKVLLGYFSVALLVTFLYDIIVSRKLKKNNRCIWVYIACAALGALVSFGAYKVINYETKEKIELEEVESVSLMNDGTYTYFSSYDSQVSFGEYEVSKMEITDEEIIDEMIYNIDHRLISMHTESTYAQLVKFNLKSGREIYRNVPTYIRQKIDNTEYTYSLERKLWQLPEYVEALNKVIPKENINSIFILEETMTYEKELEEINDIFVKEYSELSPQMKNYIQNYSGESVNERYKTLDNVYVEQGVIFGKLYVKGRIGGKDMLDTYWITDDLEETANAYIQLVNEVNMPEYMDALVNVEEGGIESEIIQLKIVQCHDNDMDEGESYYFDYINKFSYPEYFERMLEILRDEKQHTPKVGDIIISIEYLATNSTTEKTVYVSITQEEADELARIYDRLFGE